MKDYKIRVANEAESKEAQELFFELGYGFFGGKEKYFLKFEYFDEWYFFSHSGDNGQLCTWVESGINKHSPESLKDEYISELQPIEKTMSIFDTGRHVVKEYLDPDNGYVLITADEEIKGCSNWIEVPEGADIYIELTRGIHGFYKDNFKFTHHGDDWHKTEAGSDYCWINHPVLWQRQTQPEELQIISESPESSIKKLKVEWFEKFLDGVKVQYRIGGAVGKKDAQWHNFTSNALKDMTHNLIEFREAPKYVTLDGINFKTQESLLKYIVNNYNFD